MKKDRHEKIIEIIQSKDIETQEELAECLRTAGFEVTQATVSRDIRDLKLTKMSVGKGKQKYTLGQPMEIAGTAGTVEEKYIRVLKDGFTSMDIAQNLVVIRTVSGMAMAVAAALDAMKFSEVLGCIAGDDTIMVACRTSGEAANLIQKIQGKIEK